ncbi:hypothetical protein BV898_16798 [Hypsibius exemplaris]|uniref:Uncharacterized protein n=1 Tax=Hypsibius exemplaris TaxID=2072580 RepID=A0A9X6NGK7_HYPEX|nr:hypothetical protein BV898_16798 [Hypsibius exemplaris]
MLGQESNIVWKSNTDGSSNRGASLWVRNGGILCLSTGENGPCIWTPIPTPVEQSTSTPKPKSRRIVTTSTTTTTTTETTTTETTTTEATTKIVSPISSSGWPDYLQPGPSRTCVDTISSGGRQDCRTCTTSTWNGGSYWKQECRTRRQAAVPGDDGTNGKQCQEIARFSQTCTRCTWLENGRPQWHENCRWRK